MRHFFLFFVLLLAAFVGRVVCIWCYSCGQTGELSRHCNRSIACEATRCVKLEQGGEWQYSGCALPFEKITGCSWLDDGSIKCYCSSDYCNQPDYLTQAPPTPLIVGWRHTVAPQEQGNFLVDHAVRSASSFLPLIMFCFCLVRFLLL